MKNFKRRLREKSRIEVISDIAHLIPFLLIVAILFYFLFTSGDVLLNLVITIFLYIALTSMSIAFYEGYFAEKEKVDQPISLYQARYRSHGQAIEQAYTQPEDAAEKLYRYIDEDDYDYDDDYEEEEKTGDA